VLFECLSLTEFEKMKHALCIGLLFRPKQFVNFYPRDAMLARVIAIAMCLSVRPSVRHAPVLWQNEES